MYACMHVHVWRWRSSDCEPCTGGRCSRELHYESFGILDAEVLQYGACFTGRLLGEKRKDQRAECKKKDRARFG